MLNPVLRREIRTLLRTWRTIIAISVYIVILLIVTSAVMYVQNVNIMYSGFRPSSANTLYSFLCAFQLGLVYIIVPAVMGGAISGEKERQTFDLMLVTKMTTFSIVSGKLTASLLLVLLLAAASLPVFGIILYYGGVSVANILTMTLFCMLQALLAGSVAIFLSSFFKRPVVAIVVTYILLAAFSIGTLVVALVVSRVGSEIFYITQPPYTLIYLLLCTNPFMAFMSVLDSQLGSSLSFEFLQQFLYAFSYYGSVQPTMPDIMKLPMWIPNIIMSGVLIAFFVAMASILIRPAKKSKLYK